MSDKLSAKLNHLAEVDKLTDGELIDAVVEEVWANLALSSREGQLIAELLDRFQDRAGVEETPNGITQDGETLWPDVVIERSPDSQ